ncbi:MAG: BatA domain-containing protein [Pseudomonadota bacterium]
MRFLAPSLLLGLLAAALPFLLHRLGRRRANPLRFAAMALLIQAERQVAARRKLRDILLLVVRTGAAAALPLLFARPYADVRSDLPIATDRPQSAVIVLDDSASLQRRRGPIGTGTLFDAARGRARALLEGLAPESDVALVLGSEGAAAPVAEPSTDRPRLLAALDAVTCSARRGDLGAALARATQILQTASRSEKRIFLVTDLQATGFPADSGAGAPAPTTSVPVGITVLPVGADETWDNRAVVDVTAEPAPEAGAQGVAVVAEIANFSTRPATHLGVTLRLDGSEVARGFVDIPAAGKVRKRFLHAFAGGGAAHEAEVEIDGDRFALDDRRLASVEVSRGLRVLIVDGDPRTVRNEDEVFFLDAALRAGGGRFQVQVVMPEELATRRLTDTAVVFLANVARPTAETGAALIRYVEGGGGLFIAVGDRVDADVWNRHLRRILPQPLGLRRTASARPGTTEGETVDTRPAERLAPIDRRHPLLAGFSGGGEGLTSARFFQYMLLEPMANTAGRTVVLRYESGAPALVESQIGRGRVLLLTTTVDREWTDLPIRPGFLPLMQEAARRLAGAPSGEAVSALLVGSNREIPASSDDRRIEIRKPDGSNRALAPESRGGEVPASGTAEKAPAARSARTVVFHETDQPGSYHVRAFRLNGAWIDRPDETFVVNLDTRESDPAVLPPDRRPDHVGAGPGKNDHAPVRKMELWHVLGAALIGFLLLESLLTLRLRAHRARPELPARP